jgi:hypothetical protein
MRDVLLEYRKVFDQVFSKYTAFPGTVSDIPSAGHCVVAAFYLQNKLGGDIFSCNEQGISHWFNRIGDWFVDLTGDQFGYPPIRIWYTKDLSKYRIRRLEDLQPEAKFRTKLFKAKCNNFITDQMEKTNGIS